MNEQLLELKNISVSYGGVNALQDVSVHIDEGEVVALMGPNGAGKSTLLKVMFGLAPIEDGSVLWRNSEITPVPHEVVHRGISFVPQGRQIFTSLTVKENLEMGGFIIRHKKELRERIEDVLNFFPALREKLHANAGDLSGGQQQMIAIARGLMTDPHVLLLDEPTLGLAPKIVKEVFQKVAEINRERNITIIIVEHNITSVLDIVDRAYLLNHGKIVTEDTPDTLLSSGILEDVFMGKKG